MSKTTEGEFVELVRKYGLDETARITKSDRRGVQRRRKRLEEKYNMPIAAPINRSQRPIQQEYKWRAPVEIRNGIALICGDAHYWPGDKPLMHRALVMFCKEFKTSLGAVIHIGDVLDFPKISRFQPIGWESQPDVADELATGKERLDEIETASRGAELIWCLGNHDARFSTRLATVAPQYARVHGVHLTDHFPKWQPCWSSWINKGELVAKHRFSGGKHAPYNDTVKSGVSTAVGHNHSAKVDPHTDYNGTRWGTDVGCIADTDAKQFVDYTEDNPKDWRSAFGVFTFRDGHLLMPELVTRCEWKPDHVQFRGQLIKV